MGAEQQMKSVNSGGNPQQKRVRDQERATISRAKQEMRFQRSLCHQRARNATFEKTPLPRWFADNAVPPLSVPVNRLVRIRNDENMSVLQAHCFDINPVLVGRAWLRGSARINILHVSAFDATFVVVGGCDKFGCHPRDQTSPA